MGKRIQDVAATVKGLRSRYVGTERDQLLDSHIQRLFDVDDDGELTHRPVLFTRGTEARGVLFIEASGGGKTTSIERWLKRFPPLQHNPETGMPRYLAHTVESPATLKSLGAGILKQLGVDHLSSRIKVWEIWDLVRHRLQLCGITCIWLDEVHDMFGRESARELESMFKMLKSLMKGDHPVVLILSGTERMRAVWTLDPQIKRRFSLIEPRSLEIGADDRDIAQLIKIYAEAVELVSAVPEDLPARLIYGSRHRFGRVVDNIVHAVEEALMEDNGRLERHHFERAWAREEGCMPAENVFTVRDWAALDMPGEEPEPFVSSHRPKRGRRSGRRMP